MYYNSLTIQLHINKISLTNDELTQTWAQVHFFNVDCIIVDSFDLSSNLTQVELIQLYINETTRVSSKKKYYLQNRPI